jgi:hypothetical protein
MRSRTKYFLAALALGNAIATTTVADASAVNEIVRLQTQEGYSYFRN